MIFQDVVFLSGRVLLVALVGVARKHKSAVTVCKLAIYSFGLCTADHRIARLFLLQKRVQRLEKAQLAHPFPRW